MPAAGLSTMQIEAQRLLKTRMTQNVATAGQSIMRPSGSTTLLDLRRGESVRNQTLLGG